MDDLYNDYYGFDASPFNITPDPRFLFFSRKHREALAHLVFGITQRKGFIQITGEVGSGKTTLCRALLEQLGDRFRTALILNPSMTEIELLRAILEEFALPIEGNDKHHYLRTLNAFLLQQAADGMDVVLIIDEAQDLSDDLLEQVRLLSNLETDSRKLLQIVLIGQPELRDKLNDPKLRQLRQRITVRYHLEPLTRAEMESYIQHRIAISTGRKPAVRQPEFSSWAKRRIYRYTKGIPRLINAVCDKTLLAGFVAGTEQIRDRHVARAIRELEGHAT